MYRRLALALLMLLLPAHLPAAPPVQGGSIPLTLPLFPQNNWWNTDITNAPLDGNSSNFITFIGVTRGLHPDFGGDAGGGDVYGFPFIVVDGVQAKKTVTFVDYPEQSDGVMHPAETSFPFYPVPDEASTTNGWVEGGQPGNVDQRASGDRHLLMVDKTNNTLYELYNVWFNGTNWEAGSGAFFDMNTNNRRPDTWTSADAAGLAILPGLVRYDEVTGPDEIRHALRMTVQSSNDYVYPASHHAGSTMGALPMGARLRLKANKDISTFTPDIQKIFRAFKKYGLIVADNGSNMYISGTYDTRWNNDVLNPAFNALTAGDFDVVQLGWRPSLSLVMTIPSAMGAGDAANVTITAYDTNDNVATGYRGTLHFTSTDGSATLPLNYTFTSGDAGTHTFSGVILRTAGRQTVTTTDLADPTITGAQVVTVGPSTPTSLIATATSTTQVSLTWSPSPGATQYEVMRRSSVASPYASLATTATATFNDSSALANTTYLYEVRAIDLSLRLSPLSAPDAATTVLFTDEPLVTGATIVKAVHLTELRQAINIMRTSAGLTPATFTDPSPAGATIKAVHVQELRNAAASARSALGLSAFPFTDPALAPGLVTKAAHVQDLRSAVK